MDVLIPWALSRTNLLGFEEDSFDRHFIKASPYGSGFGGHTIDTLQNSYPA
jgi:hypothetical protein